MSSIVVRAILQTDWPQIGQLEAEAYNRMGLTEGIDVLMARTKESARTCFVAEDEETVGAYLLAIPYPRFSCPPLGVAEAPSSVAENLHVHDVVVARHLHSRGVVAQLLDHLSDTARLLGFTHISGVAVGRSAPYWERQGFRSYPDIAVGDSYGHRSTYMSKMLA